MSDLPPHSFRFFCETVQQIAETRATDRKSALFASYLNQLACETDIELAARFAGEGAFPAVSGKKASVGSRTVGHAACRFLEIDYEKVYRPCRAATGSASETIEKLSANLEAAIAKRQPAYPTLQELEAFYHKLASARNREQKEEHLLQMWEQLTPLEMKYSLRILSQGSLRIGFEARSIMHAIAHAFSQDPEEVRYTHMITGNLGQTAVLSFRNELEQAQFTLFQPISFMLAAPAESRSVEDLSSYIAEEKLDGMRCQVHIDGGKIALYSRDLNEITASFPDVADYFRSRQSEPAVIDGELCVFRKGELQSFNDLQQRMGVKKPDRKLLETYPVRLVAYDLLYLDGRVAFELPLEERRQLLADWCRRFEVPMTRHLPVTEPSDVDRLFEDAVNRGNEGLILKKRNSRYEYGERRNSWLKIKKPGGSLDTVIMYAHAGSGKRGGTYSDFTLGIRVAEDERYEEEFIPIGKANGGYSDDELRQLNRDIRNLAVERFGPTLSLRPGFVVEAEFEEIRTNRRTKAGYTLRLPRFRAIRRDLSPQDCNTLRDVEEEYRRNQRHKEQAPDRNRALVWE